MKTTLFDTEERVDPAPYHALWHLAAIGVLDINTGASALWDKASDNITAGNKVTRVAILDNSVDYEHPNLAQAVDRDRMVDFVSAPFGSFLGDTNPFDGIAIPGFDPTTLGTAPTIKSVYDDLEERLQLRAIVGLLTNDTINFIAPAISSRFSAHGTAIAGLIGARPATNGTIPPVNGEFWVDGGTVLSDDPVIAGSELHLPYAGVDPFCNLVPISTGFDADPKQFIAALLYAYMIEADVIVLPRDFADPKRSPMTNVFDDEEQKLLAELTPVTGEASGGTDEEWDALEDLLLTLSKKIPIVCAAGNDRDAAVIYPARLADTDNGIISVGPHTWRGSPSGFAPADDLITLYAPSGDGEIFEDDKIALNPSDLQNLRQEYAPLDRVGLSNEVFQPQQIITTDVSGRYGYNNRPLDVPDDPADFGAYFTPFSGTSAASAITAGFISLMISSGEYSGKNGPQIKAALIAGQANDPPNAEPKLRVSP